MISGGCYCGRVRYEVAGEPFQETNCHCSICRRTSGAAFVTWFTVQRSSFRLLRGTPIEFRSTPQGTRRFCPRCGTQLTFEHQDFPDEIDVNTCSLDDPNSVSPRDHTHIGSKLQWIRLADGLPEFREGRDEPGR